MPYTIGLDNLSKAPTQPGLWRRGLNAALGGLNTLGKVLDTPASVVRGVTKGDPVRALKGIFDTEQRVTGSELLGKPKDELSLGGVITEIALDPLTYLTFGTASAAGKLAERGANLTTKQRALSRIIAAQASSNPNTIGRLAEVDKALAEVTAKLGGKLPEYGKTLGDRIRSGQAMSIGIGLPFTQSTPLLQGSGKVADAVGKLGTVVTGNKAYGALRDKFNPKAKTPFLEETRQELRRIMREEKQRAALKFTHDQSQIAALEKLDPDVQAKIIDLVERKPEAKLNALKELAETLPTKKKLDTKGIDLSLTKVSELYPNGDTVIEHEGKFILPGNIVVPVNLAYNKTTKDLRVDWIGVGGKASPDIGASNVRGLLNAALEKFPEAKTVSGERISGIRGSEEAKAADALNNLGPLDDADELVKRFQRALNKETKVPIRPTFITKPSGDPFGELLRLRLKAEEQLANVPPEALERAREIELENASMLERAQAAGVPVQQLESDLGYFSRQLTAEGHEVLRKKSARRFVNKFLKERAQPFQMTREQRDKTLLELNEALAKQYRLPAGTKVFDTDITRVMAGRDVANQKAINRAIFAQVVADEYAVKAPKKEVTSAKGKVRKVDDTTGLVGIENVIGRGHAPGKKGYIGPLVASTKSPTYREMRASLGVPPQARRSYVQISVDASDKEIKAALKDAGVNRRHIPEEIYKDFARMTQLDGALVDPDSWVMKAVKAADDVHALFRSAMTRYFPAYHARNAVNDVFMNTLARDVGIEDYYQAMKLLPKMSDAQRIKYAGLGILDGSAMSELDEILAGPRATIFDKSTSLLGKAPKPLRTAAEKTDELAKKTSHYIANVSRLAHYLGKRRAGLTETEAADSVIKYLFDYNDLTQFERAVPRRAMMFYTFYRKNLPLMLETVFTNPRFAVNYARATGKTVSGAANPPWMGDSFFLNEDEKQQQVRLNFGLAPEDLARMDPQGQGMQRVLELVINNLVPAIKMPIEMVADKSMHSGKAIEGGPGERLLQYLPTARFTGTAQRMFQASEGGELGSEIARFLTGVNAQRVSVPDVKEQKRINEIRNRLDQIISSGDARKFEVVGNRRGMDNPEITALNKELGRLTRRPN